ncbi:hypothetical protein DC094_10155 [Pelagibaculum spongiae]|uniref:RND transporter n=2 Tax=Pelagibaculum spongiae TaxID=2080658 RepID=A0A2V1GWV6_9GAMM|nr:hypothetical protein DC094_10155 [Pelagibaculum spongiae]
MIFSSQILAADTANNSLTSQQPVKRSLCVFDVVGANGDIFNMMKDYRLDVLQWGVDLQLKAYTDERVASDDFKTGQCDSVLMTGTRARAYNHFTGTLEALGAIPSYQELKLILNTLLSPRAAKLMVQDDYEVVGIMPAGGVYLFVRDRKNDNLSTMAGKRVATLDYDPASLEMVRQVGASVVSSSTTSFAGKFNNGSVDIAYAPAAAYKPLELYHGIKPNGGVINHVVSQLNLQMLIRKDLFPEGFGKKSRAHTLKQLDMAFEIILKADQEIEEEYWITPPLSSVHKSELLFRKVRTSLKDNGTYNPKALAFMKKVRCKVSPAAAECSQKSD